MCIIPSGCLDHARLHFRAELDPPLHLEKREQSRVFISFSGTAEPRGLLILRKSLLHQGCQPKYQTRYATFKSIPTPCKNSEKTGNSQTCGAFSRRQ